MEKFINKTVRLLASEKFFWFVLVFFVLQAAWVALSFRYPLPFDEYYHYGLIQFYSDHISPILTSQPHSADLYGDIVRHPSYLYHYLLSFPYRLIEVVFHTTTAQIIALRFINITIFGAGLFVFRKVFLKAGISRAGINTILLFFVLLPEVSFVAAHINYDSLTLLAAALSIYLCQLIALDRKQLSFKLLGLLLVTNLLGSLVKYVFMPIFLAEAVFLGWILYKRGKNYRDSLVLSFKKSSQAAKILLLLFIAVSSFLFFQRIGINLIKYKIPSPSCKQVLSVERCKHNPTFNNAQKAKQDNKNRKVSTDPMLYTSQWLYNMEAGYFVTGANTSDGHIGTAAPPSILRYAFAALLFTGTALIIYYWRSIKRNVVFKLYITIALIYTAALWLQNYRGYIHTKSLIAINARYLFPVILLMLVIFLVAYSMSLKGRQGTKLLLVGAILLIFTQGGGVLNSIRKAEPTWYWQRTKVINTNLRIKKAVNHFEIFNKP